ncbi:MAG: thioredoxin family protein [Candidatus Omnitrophica bacterium]|nr:thioredoxin family protein [Candidatus Omnitrophota bacterium]
MTQDWLGLAGLFAAGVALNLTPCVYPMLSITVSIFSKTGNKTLFSSFLSALVYVFGITVMYSALGVSAAIGGGFFGALLQSPWVQLVIAAFMFSMALSMFGVFKVQAPSFILSRLGHKPVGMGGLFLSGLLVGIFAAPCIGPPVAALLAHVAEHRDPVYGFSRFFVLALGLGFPYLIFGTFSHWIKALPKAGAWMVWVDRLFGVILIGFAGFYLMLALGSWDLLPTARVERHAQMSDTGQSANSSLAWTRYTPAVLERALKSGRPVIADFYADWCLPCQEMEAVTYRNAKVKAALGRFELIKVDLTDAGDETQMALAECYQVYGIPTMLFFDDHGSELTHLRATGYINPNDFLEILDQVPENTAS